MYKIDTQELFDEVVQSQNRGELSERLREIFEEMVTRYANFGEWFKVKYDPYRQEMIDTAMTEITVKWWKNYNAEKCNHYPASAVRYFITCASLTFHRIKKEYNL